MYRCMLLYGDGMRLFFQNWLLYHCINHRLRLGFIYYKVRCLLFRNSIKLLDSNACYFGRDLLVFSMWFVVLLHVVVRGMRLFFQNWLLYRCINHRLRLGFIYYKMRCLLFRNSIKLLDTNACYFGRNLLVFSKQVDLF